MEKLKNILRWGLVNLRWIMVAIIAVNALPIIEQGTARGLDDETAFWSVVVLALTVGLFIFNKKYPKVLDKFITAK